MRAILRIFLHTSAIFRNDRSESQADSNTGEIMSAESTAPLNGANAELVPQLERSLTDIGIPPCPAILTRVMTEIQKDEPDYAHLTAIIGSDVAISAGLIKTANSPFFSRQRRARSVSEAITILGLSVVSHVIAGLVLRKAFPDSPTLHRFWDSSARIARISGWLAHKLDIPGLTAEDAYTFGLFRDSGIPVLLLRHPQYSDALILANNETTRAFTDIESATVPEHHATVGSLLAQSWWLPEEIYLGIRAHHNLPALEATDSLLPMLCRQLIATSQLAEHLLQRQLGLCHTQEWPKLGAACLSLLRLDEDDLEFLYTVAQPVVAAEE